MTLLAPSSKMGGKRAVKEDGVLDSLYGQKRNHGSLMLMFHHFIFLSLSVQYHTHSPLASLIIFLVIPWFCAMFSTVKALCKHCFKVLYKGSYYYKLLSTNPCETYEIRLWLYAGKNFFLGIKLKSECCSFRLMNYGKSHTWVGNLYWFSD